MRQGNHLSQVVSTVSLGLVHFYPIFFSLHVLTHKYSPYALSDLSGALHFYASAVCANNPLQPLPSDSLLPSALAHVQEARVRNQEPTGRANHFNKHHPTKQSPIFFIWHPLFYWVAPWYEWGKTDSLEYVIGHDISSSPTSSWLNINFHGLQYLKVEHWLRTDSNSCTDGGEKEHGLHCFLSVAWNQSEEEKLLHAGWNSRTLRYLTSFWICQYSEGRSVLLSGRRSGCSSSSSLSDELSLKTSAGTAPAGFLLNKKKSR